MSYQKSPILAAACACVLSLAAVNAFAQTPPADNKTTELEEVVVTGSFIKGTPTDTAMPVEVTNLEQLRNLGSPSNIDFIKAMTESGATAGETNRYNAFPIGAATINLRDIGSRFTLVLFNGRRFPEQYSVAVGRFNNIAWIPNGAIGRVETLKEGGGVTYGADAVGGVVNYITRKDVDGLELSADYRYIEDSSGDYTANALWGKKFGDSDFLITAGYQHRSNLRSLDRDWARKQYLENDSAFAWATAGSPGSYLLQTQRNTAGAVTPGTWTSITSLATAPANRYGGNYQQSAAGVIRDPNCSALGGFAGWTATPTAVCYFQLGQFEKLVEEQNQYNVYGEFNHRFGDSGVKYHMEVLGYYQDVPDIAAHPSDGPLAYPIQAGSLTGAPQTTGVGSSYFVPSSNPAVGQFLGTVKNANGSLAYNAQLADFNSGNGRVVLSGNTWRLFGNGGNPLTGAYDIQHNWTKLFRMTHQFTGDLPEFWGTALQWDVSVTYDHVIDHKQINDVLVDRLQAALNGFGGSNCSGTTAGANGCMYLNPFSSAIPANFYTGAVNPGFVGTGTFAGYTAGQGLQNNLDLLRWLYVPIWLERTYNDVTVDPLITGKTGFTLPGGPISIAFGGQFRYRSEDTELDDLDNRVVNPCATIGVTTCTSRSGVFAFTRSTTVLGAPADLLASPKGRTNRKFPAAALFLETELPVLDTLTVNLAGRYEKFYSDITDKDNSVFVPAGSIKWQALPWLAARGSIGRTFSQVNPPPDAPPLVNPNNLNTTYGSVAYTSASYNNVDVKPMKGIYFDVGFIIQAGQFQGSVDWYQIEIDNYTRTMTQNNVVSALVNPGQNPAATNLINCSSPLLTQVQGALGGRPFVELNGPCVQGVSQLNSPAGGGGITRLNYFPTTDETNSGLLTTSGIDANLAYNFENVVGGTLTPSIDFTYITKWYLGDFIVGGVTVTPGYDGVGYRNDSSNRNLQAVPQYRGTFGVNYHNGIHNLNIALRYLPSLIEDNATSLFSETAARNANVGDANGFTTGGAGCASPYVSDPNRVSNLGATPAGAGTGTYGIGAVVVPNPPGVTTPAVGTGSVGFCGSQDYQILSGQKIKAQTNIDLTYRVNLPAETDLTFTIYNLTNQDPTFERNNVNYDPGFGTPLGRNFKLQILKRF